MMTPNADKIQFALGCDVAKDTVTLFDSSTRRTITVDNTATALKAAFKPYAGYSDMLALCEATGGYEDELLRLLASLDIPAHRADAARVKAFIRACGTRAKTDPIDAAISPNTVLPGINPCRAGRHRIPKRQR